MTAATETAVTTQVYRVYIKATPQAIWDAITKPEWTQRYGYTNIADFDLRPGGAYRSYPSEPMKRGAEAMGIPLPDVVVDGELNVAQRRRKLLAQHIVTFVTVTVTETNHFLFRFFLFRNLLRCSDTTNF